MQHSKVYLSNGITWRGALFPIGGEKNLFSREALIRSFEVPPRYWREAPHEVDFIIQREGVVIPVEAKAGENVRASSIKRYEKKYPAETPVMVRLSMRNLSFDGKMLNVPLSYGGS